MTEKEHGEVIAFTVKTVRKRVPIIAGTGSNSTAEAILYTRHAKEVGADAALLVCPYYNKPSQKGMVAHFTAIAEAVDIPQILYNIPGRSVVNMTPETVAELSRHRNIVGIKEASGNLEQMIKIKSLCRTGFLTSFPVDDTIDAAHSLDWWSRGHFRHFPFTAAGNLPSCAQLFGR